MVKDPIIDDQSLVMHLRGKGLVVISGCAHSGIINTLLHSKKLSEWIASTPCSEDSICRARNLNRLSKRPSSP